MKIELMPFVVPDSVGIKMPPRPRQEGFLEGPKFDLSELDTDDLSELCNRCRKDVFQKAGKEDHDITVFIAAASLIALHLFSII